ncbi:MAG: hypothetical protein IPN14_05840 [Bacteroidetes bacterium]|nr:hypothetical protein [Bacteroidota bacterium]
MFTKSQQVLLDNFADQSDNLFNLGIITSDSFTGEIGEYIACTYFKLQKSNRSTKAFDGICKLGEHYQVKATVVSNDNYRLNISRLDTTSFTYLVIVYLDGDYCPLRIARIPATEISGNKISITSSLLASGIEIFERNAIRISPKNIVALREFAKANAALVEAGIIRSKRVVGDIGEYYACKKLNLVLCNNKIQKGFDAIDINGNTYEIKTRRVYQSSRRISEKRRLNNLNEKSADFLVVVVLDRTFKCAGMWVLPMKNIANPKSAHLEIVNTTPGTQNIIASKIPGLSTGSRYIKNTPKIITKETNPIYGFKKRKRRQQTAQNG